jgi:predicted cupin superfamily sugar epimerase
MTKDLSVEEIRALLKLEPHATGGFVRVTFISNQRIAPGGLPAPFLGGRQVRICERVNACSF